MGNKSNRLCHCMNRFIICFFPDLMLCKAEGFANNCFYDNINTFLIPIDGVLVKAILAMNFGNFIFKNIC